MSDHQMNQNHMGNGDDVLERATAALRDARVSDGPPPLVMQRMLCELRAAETGERITDSSQLQKKRVLTMRFITRFAVAACIALAAGLLIWGVATRSSLAFAEVVEQVKQAKSVRFKATTTVQVPLMGKQVFNSTMIISGNRMRQEMPQGISIFDMAAGEMISLQPATKQAFRVKMTNMPPNVKGMNLMEQFRVLKPENAKDLGTKEIDGRTLHGFGIEQAGVKLTVWADPKTQAPVQIESAYDMPSIPSTVSVMKDFDWDKPVDPMELSLDVPKGYTEQTVTMDASQPTEKDLIEGLRMLAQMNRGSFTVSFDVAGMSGAMARQAVSRMSSRPTTQDVQALQAEFMPKAVKVSRGISFINPMNGEDFRYAGGGVKLNQKNRPILWYKPKGSTNYRVIDAELNVREVEPDQLPKIASKKLIGGASPFPTTATSQPATTKVTPAAH